MSAGWNHCSCGRPTRAPKGVHCRACQELARSTPASLELERQRSRDYYQRNKAARSKLTLEHYLKNKELIREQQRLYRERNRAYLKAYAATWRLMNPGYKPGDKKRKRIFEREESQ